MKGTKKYLETLMSWDKSLNYSNKLWCVEKFGSSPKQNENDITDVIVENNQRRSELCCFVRNVLLARYQFPLFFIEIQQHSKTIWWRFFTSLSLSLFFLSLWFLLSSLYHIPFLASENLATNEKSCNKYWKSGGGHLQTPQFFRVRIFPYFLYWLKSAKYELTKMV